MISPKSRYVSEFGPLWCMNFIFHISVYFVFSWFPTLELSVPYILCWKQHGRQAEEQNKDCTAAIH